MLYIFHGQFLMRSREMPFVDVISIWAQIGLKLPRNKSHIIDLKFVSNKSTTQSVYCFQFGVKLIAWSRSVSTASVNSGDVPGLVCGISSIHSIPFIRTYMEYYVNVIRIQIENISVRVFSFKMIVKAQLSLGCVRKTKEHTLTYRIIASKNTFYCNLSCILMQFGEFMIDAMSKFSHKKEYIQNYRNDLISIDKNRETLFFLCKMSLIK